MVEHFYVIALAAILPTAGFVAFVLQLRANDRAAERRHAESMAGLQALRLWGGVEVAVSQGTGRITPPGGVRLLAAEGRKTIEEIAAEMRGPDDEPRAARDLAAARGYVCQPADPGMLGGLGMATGFHILGAVIYQPGPREERSILEGLAEAALEEEGHEPTATNVERLVALLTAPALVRIASL